MIHVITVVFSESPLLSSPLLSIKSLFFSLFNSLLPREDTRYRMYNPFTNPYLRSRKHFPCFYRVIETRVEVWENEKCCGNTSRRRVFPQLFRVHEERRNTIINQSARVFSLRYFLNDFDTRRFMPLNCRLKWNFNVWSLKLLTLLK